MKPCARFTKSAKFISTEPEAGIGAATGDAKAEAVSVCEGRWLGAGCAVMLIRAVPADGDAAGSACAELPIVAGRAASACAGLAGVGGAGAASACAGLAGVGGAGAPACAGFAMAGGAGAAVACARLAVSDGAGAAAVFAGLAVVAPAADASDAAAVASERAIDGAVGPAAVSLGPAVVCGAGLAGNTSFRDLPSAELTLLAVVANGDCLSCIVSLAGDFGPNIEMKAQATSAAMPETTPICNAISRRLIRSWSALPGSSGK